MKNQRYTLIGLLVVIIAITTINLSGLWDKKPSLFLEAPDPTNENLVALGQSVYAKHCASCHGTNLEGQKNWHRPRTNDRPPAPPHDVTGHTWHHSDDFLLNYTYHGGRSFMPKGLVSNMPAFKNILTTRKISSVIAFIKSRWPPDVLRHQELISKKAN